MPTGDMDPDLEVAMTRSEVLRQRGYPAAVVNGNGNGKPAPVVESPPCVICSGPVPAGRVRGRKKTCGERCEREARTRRGATTEVATSSGSPTVTNGAGMDNGSTGPANGVHGRTKDAGTIAGTIAGASPASLDRLGLLPALVSAGAQVVRVELVVAGECWTVTRTTTNGGP